MSLQRARFLLLSLLSISSLSAVAYGSLFLWNDQVRPPISLEKALEIAKEKLGDDYDNRYCVSVQLYGNPFAKPKPGAWNLFYAATDGSKKHVYVDMDGNAEVQIWNRAIDWKQNRGFREDLADIKRRLEAFFAKEQLTVKFEEADGRIVASYNTRTFHVHKPEEGAEFSEELIEMVGPKADGFIIELSTTAIESRRVFENEPYWVSDDETFPLQDGNTFVRVQSRRGYRFKNEYEVQLEQIFGRQFKDR